LAKLAALNDLLHGRETTIPQYFAIFFLKSCRRNIFVVTWKVIFT